jgi:hypothetical protein
VVASPLVFAVACAVIYSLAKILALIIALRGSKPSERAELIEAVAELFRTRPWPRTPRALTRSPAKRPQRPTKSVTTQRTSTPRAKP